MRAVKLTYFKKHGKYYTDETYISEYNFDYDIYTEIRLWHVVEDGNNLPGLSTNSWDGYILVQPEDGVPALIDLRS